MVFTIYLIGISLAIMGSVVYVVRESIRQDAIATRKVEIDFDSNKQVKSMMKFMKTDLFKQIMQLDGKEL